MTAAAPIPDDAWARFERNVRNRSTAARRCLKEIGTILTQHGEKHSEYEHIVRVTLRVDC